MLKASHQTPQNIFLGVSLIVVTAFAISVQDVVFKLFSNEMTLWQIFTLRGCLAVPVLVLIAYVKKGASANVRFAFGRWPLLRAMFITGTFLAFYAAVPFLSLSTVGAANYTAPLFVALLSAYVIKEPVGWFGWIGVLIGFVGVVVLLQPGTEAFSAWALLPIIGALSYALAHIITRTKCQDVPLAALSLAQNFAMLCCGLAVSSMLLLTQPRGALARAYPYIFDLWAPVGPDDWMILSVLAGFSIVLGMMLAGAYKAAPPPIVATFEYSYLVFVAAWDVFFFGLIHGGQTLGGMSLIFLAGLLVLGRGSES